MTELAQLTELELQAKLHLERLWRREQLRSSQKQTLPELREVARELPPVTPATLFFEQLEQGKDVVDAVALEAVTVIEQVIAREFPQLTGVSIVLLGSSAHGGAVARTLFQENEPSGQEEPRDFDWAVLSDTKFDDKTMLLLLTETRRAFRTKFGDSLESCYRFNPYIVRTTNLKSVNEAKEVLLDLIEYPFKSKSLYIWDFAEVERFLLFLQPSVPAHTNEKNQTLLKNALRQLTAQQPETAARITTVIESIWNQSIMLKEKHFTNSRMSHRDQKLIETIVAASPHLMARKISRILLGAATA